MWVARLPLHVMHDSDSHTPYLLRRLPVYLTGSGQFSELKRRSMSPALSG